MFMLKLTESSMLLRLEEFVRENFYSSRLPNPDYRKNHYYGPQWQCLGALYWYEFRGVVYAVRKHDGTCYFSRTGINIRPFQNAEVKRHRAN